MIIQDLKNYISIQRKFSVAKRFLDNLLIGCVCFVIFIPTSVIADSYSQSNWSSYSYKDDEVTIVNSDEDLELDYGSANSASIQTNPINTNDKTSAVEIIRWNETLVTSTDIQIQIRTAPDSAGSPGAWTPWMGPDGTSSTFWNSANTHDGKCLGAGSIECFLLPEQITTAKNNQWLQLKITLQSSVAFTPSLASVEVVYSTNRIGQWRFDGTVNDETFRARTAVLSSEAMFVSDGDRNALSADGLNGYAKASGFIELGVTSPYTYEGWVKIEDGVTDGSIIHLSETSNGRGLCYSPVSLVDGKIVATSFDGTSLNSVTATNAVMSDIWYHFANTWDPVDGLKLYVNGLLQGTSPQPSLGTNSSNMYVHFGFDDPSYTCEGDTGSYFYGLPYSIPVFHGLIDEVSVYDVALDAETISARTALEALPIAPIFDSTAILDAISGESYKYEVMATDADNGVLAITGTQMPAWLTVNDYGNGYAILSGTPGAFDAGLHDVTLTVSDGSFAIDQVFQITVKAAASAGSNWKYDGDALDSGPNNRNGTLYGGATYSGGIDGQAIVLDGVDDRVTQSGSKYFVSTNVPYTHMGWVNVATGETDGNVLYYRYSGYHCYVPISIVNGKLVATSKASYSGPAITVTSDAELAKDTWYHFATTWDSVNGLRLYINGVLEGSTPQSAFYGSGSSTVYTLYVGYGTTNSNCRGNTYSHFAGMVDDIQVFNMSLGESQIFEIYESMFNEKPTGDVTIDGTTTENSILYANTSSLADDNGLGAFNYQWTRNGVDISGATSEAYTLTQEDVNHVMGVKVDFTDGAGYLETFESDPSAVIANVNDLPVGTVNVVGDFIQGQTISVEVNLSDLDGLGLLNYQWYRDGTKLNNEKGVSYQLEADDVGRKFTVEVSYTDGHDTVDSFMSGETVTIANVNDLPEGEVSINGSLKEDALLSASNTVTDIDGVGPIHYQWLRNGIAIEGADQGNYYPGDLDVGQKLSVRMSYVDGYGTTETLTSAETIPIANNNDLPTGGVYFVGTFKVGETITLDEQLTDADGLGSFAYAWKRSTSGNTGVTNSDYMITDADVGSTLSVVISYIDGYGKLEKFTAKSAIVVEGNKNQAPVISPLHDMTIEMNVVTNGITFNVSDDATSLSKMNVSVYSANQDLIPDKNIRLGTTETGYEISLTPKQNAYGSLTLTIKANDGVAESIHRFLITITGQDSDQDGIPDLADLDDDNDGVPDSYELANNMNPLDPADAELDSDGDGNSNFDDYQSSYEPDTSLELEGTVPTIKSPKDIVIDANGLYTEVELGNAEAIDGLGNEIAAFADQEGPFQPGVHIITWVASDTLGNSITAEQVVNVIPLVNFAMSQTVDEGSTVNITAKLNGNAVRYPVTIPYTLSGTANNPEDHNLEEGNIIIENGLEGSVSVDIVKDDLREMTDETIVVEMGTPHNAVQGSVNRHTVRIVEYNVAPTVTLKALQNSRVTNLVVINDGDVIIRADIQDPNREDTHSYNWQLSDNSLIDTDEVDETFTVDAKTLGEGIHILRLNINDSGTPVESAGVELTINVVNEKPQLSRRQDKDNDGISDYDEGFGDEDGDRIPNYLDTTIGAQIIPLLQNINNAYLVETTEGNSLRLGNIAFAAGDNRAGVTVAQLDKYSQIPSAIDNVANIGGYADIELHGLSEKGASAKLILPQVSEIPHSAVLRVLKTTGWEDYAVDGKNELHSAPGSQGYCPPPGDATYTVGLTPGYWCVQLTLQDGGMNDIDGEANSVVRYSGGVGKPIEADVGAVITETVSKASLLYLLLSSIVLVVGRRRL